MATKKQTYTRVLQCSPASVGIAQARPNNRQKYPANSFPFQRELVSLAVKKFSRSGDNLSVLCNWTHVGKEFY